MSVGNFIDRIQIGNANQIAIGSSAYGVCNTAANVAAKTCAMPGFVLNHGTTIHIKFINNNTAANPTLNVNNTGDIPIISYGDTAAGIEDEVMGWHAGSVLTLTYDETVVNENITAIWIRNASQTTNTQQKIDSSRNGQYSLLQSAVSINTITDDIARSTYRTDNIYVEPSTGTIFANKFHGNFIFTDNNNVITTVGNVYTPIYWNDGLPTVVTVVQKVPFSISSNETGARITHNSDNTIFTSNSIVIQIVVESGEEYLKGPLSWTSADGYIDITSTQAVSGIVSGYILLVRGQEFTSLEITSSPIPAAESQTLDNEP